MNDLPPHLRSLLDAAQKAHEPSEHDRERVFRALSVTLGGAGLSAVATALTSGAAHASGAYARLEAPASTSPSLGASLSPSAPLATSAASVGLGTKALLAVAIAVGSASLWPLMSAPPAAHPTPAVHAGSGSLDAPASTSTEVAASGAAPSARGVQEGSDTRNMLGAAQADGTQHRASDAALSAQDARPSPGSTTELRPVEAIELDLPTSVATPRMRTARTTSGRSRALSQGTLTAPSNSAPPPTLPSMQPELHLVRQTLTALRDQNPQQALIWLEEHAQRFPRGSMVRERLGLRVVALCAAGQLESGRREQAAYLQKDNQSPLAKRVRAACGGEVP